MNYFDVWKAVKTLGYDDSEFCEHFLANDIIIEEVFKNGSEKDLSTAVELLCATSLDELIDCIEDTTREFKPADVPCFSSLEKGLKRVNELLAFHEEGVSFQQLGFLLNGATTAAACIKYGENHAKLASLASLVEISDSKPAVVKATALGQFLLAYSEEERQDMAKKLLLRDPYIQQLVNGAKNGEVSYKESVSSLRLSTAIRRRTSVKAIIRFILEHTKYQDSINSINWSV